MNQAAGMLREIIRLQEAFLDALEDMLDEIEGDVEEKDGAEPEPQGLSALHRR